MAVSIMCAASSEWIRFGGNPLRCFLMLGFLNNKGILAEHQNMQNSNHCIYWAPSAIIFLWLIQYVSLLLLLGKFFHRFYLALRVISTHSYTMGLVHLLFFSAGILASL